MPEAAALAKNESITSLEMQSNMIGPNVFSRVLNARGPGWAWSPEGNAGSHRHSETSAEVNNTLRSLNLRSNQLCDDGVWPPGGVEAALI